MIGKGAIMKKKTLIAMMIAVGIMTGCGQTETKQPIVQVLDPEPIVKDEVEDSAEEPADEALDMTMDVITDREVVDGKMQSYLTGEWKDEAVVKRRNMAVMMPNNKKSLPQYGISQASIIYEAPVEGRITRLMAVFEDYDDLDRIGPTRSSRDYYVYEAMGMDSIYVNWGLAVPYVAPLINTDRVDNISQAVSGIEVSAMEAFDRVSRSGYATEYTGYMFIDGYNDAVERLGYETEYREDRFEKVFTFEADNSNAADYEDYPEATKIYPGGTEGNRGGYGDAQPCFTYNEEDGLYYRTQYDGIHYDEMNDEQLTVSNVIFKVCEGAVRDDHDYLIFGIHGEGDAYVFTNGKVIEAKWERKGDYDPNMYYDENGNEIVLNQGKTWVCIIWKDYAEYIKYE